MFFVSPNQINIQAPANLPLGPVNVVVTNGNLVSGSLTTTVVQAAPSFFYTAGGTNLYVAAVHLNGELAGDPAVLVLPSNVPSRAKSF